MKKINLINISLLLILLICFYYDNHKTNNNLEKIEKNFLQNYNDINNKKLFEENKKLTTLLKLEKTNLNISIVRGFFINPYEEFIINKGKNHNLKNGYLVLNETRLIGFIKNIHNNYANVELLENLNRKLSIKVNDSYGFLENSNKKLIISGIAGENMKIGDLVYTSGLTDVLGDVYIGKINKIVENDDTFETEAYLSIETNYNDYKYLMVVEE